ncbi:SDR family oxidoreductase [soil metagenome]
MPYTNFYKDKTILVTGGAGAIGRNLVESLTKLLPKKIIILDNLSSSYVWNIPNNQNVLFIKGDIRNENDLRRSFHHKPTIVFHLAAFFANQNSVDYPLISEEVNGQGILKLLEYCVISGNIEKFVYTNSEGGAYGPDCTLPYVENKISLNLGSPYYISKMAAESYCYYYNSFYKLPISVVRLFNSYGPGEVPGQYRNVIPNFIYWALKKQPLPLTGHKNISRDFVFVNDTVEGILRAGFFKDAEGTAINIATGKETLIYDIANIINSKTSNPSGIHVLEQRKWDTREKIIGSNKKCEEILQFKPSNQLEKGIDLTIKWVEENWKNIEQSADFLPGLNPAIDVEKAN